GAAHRPGRGHLAAEPGAELRIGGQLVVDDLDRHRPPGRRVAQEYLPHAAGPEAGPQPVPTHLPRGSRRQWLHRSTRPPEDYHRMPATRGAEPRSSPPDSAVDDGGGDPGYMLRRPPEKLAGAVRALEVAMGVVLPGDADGAVHLDHLARHPGQ